VKGKTVIVTFQKFDTYQVEGEDLTDAQAVAIVKARIEAEMPLGLVKEEQSVQTFSVSSADGVGALFDADGTIIIEASPDKKTKK
jgi:hypothetical protein